MNTDEKILRAALGLFSEMGYSATTTKMIAQNAGVNEVTLFRHFDNKRGIFNAIIEQLVDIKEINNFYATGLTNDLKADLTQLSHHLSNVYKSNSPIIRMIFMDHELCHKEKRMAMHSIVTIRENMDEYFKQMHIIGEMSDNPDKCMKFFFSNVVGYLMNVYIMSVNPFNEEYYNWMVEKTISAIATSKG